jgi:hypothetical protein
VVLANGLCLVWVNYGPAVAFVQVTLRICTCHREGLFGCVTEMFVPACVLATNTPSVLFYLSCFSIKMICRVLVQK